MTASFDPSFVQSNFPAALRDLRQWVAWKLEERKGQKKPTKVPYTASGAHASSTDPATWCSLADALSAYAAGGFSGVGFVFAGDGLVGIDLDHCRDAASGAIAPWAKEILDRVAGYSEASPSGTGIHVIVRGTLSGAGRKRRVRADGGDAAAAIEIYDRGRYFTVTGDRLLEYPAGIEERQAAIDQVYASMESKAKAPPRSAPPPSSGAPDDDELLRRAMASKSGAAIFRLWNGSISDHGDDDSAADLALCSHLAFWCGPDPNRIDRLFRRSGLYREKWERQDYRERTIARALDGRTEFHAERAAATPPDGPDSPDDSSPADPRPRGILCTDLGNARRLVRRYGRDLRYCASLGWFAWDGKRWKKDETGMAMRLAKDIAESIWDEVKKAATTEDRDRIVAWALKSQGAPRLSALLAVASTELPIAVASADFDQDPWALNVRNGTLDLRTGKLRPHRREDLLTKLAPVDYDPAATCPSFDRFISQVFEGKTNLIAFVQKACGYSLTGDVALQVLFFLHGEGANGKSTLIEVLLHVLGEYAAPAAPDLLLARRGERHPTEIADLFGRRLVSCVEVGQGRGINEALVKWLTGADRLKARLMRMDFFDFVPTHKVFLCANHKPRVRETNHAFWRRIRLIPFNVIFKPRPAGTPAATEFLPGEQDPELPRKLRAEAAGILRWAVEGCLRMQAEGLAPPKEVVDATNDYRQGEDVLGLFFTECCVLAPGARSGKTELYDTYSGWAKQSGEDALPNREFRKALLERHFTEDRGTAGKRMWVGIGLAHDPANHPSGDTVTRPDSESGMGAISPPHDPGNPDSTSSRVTPSPDAARLFPETPSDDADGETF